MSSRPLRPDPARGADVAVIGGGIVGTSLAALLAERGLSVDLYEREALAAGASGRNSGVVQLPFDPALRTLYERTVELYRRLEEEAAGFVLGREPVGLLLVTRDEPLVRGFARDLARTAPDVRTEIVSGAELQALEPALAPDLMACRLPLGFPVIPSSGTYAFATVGERRGVRIRMGREVAIAMESERAIGVRVDGRIEPAGAVVVAAGPWTPGLLDPTGEWRPIKAQWGVVVETLLANPPRHVMEEAELDAALGSPSATPGSPSAAPGSPSADDAIASSPSEPPPSVAHESGFSIVTAAGVSSVGSTFLDAEPDSREWQVPLLSRAETFVPAIGDAPIRGTRACARPVSADGRPLVGRVEWIERCYVAAGHGPWGISTGPGSAELLVELMLGDGTCVVPAELDAARFAPPGATSGRRPSPA